MKKIIIVIFSLFVFANFANAKVNPDTIKIRLNTPRDAVMLHWKYLQKDSYFPKIAAKALFLTDKNRRKGEELAIKLMKIFQGRALIIGFAKIPTSPDFTDSLTGRSMYYPFINYGDIYLERINGAWRYSEETVDNINAIYDEIYPFTISSYVDKIPSFLRFKLIFGMELWQVVAVFLLIFIVYLLQRLLRFIVRFVLKFLFTKLESRDFIDKHFRPVVRAISGIIALSLAALLVPILDLPLKVHIAIVLIYRVVLLIWLIVLSFRITDYIYYRTRKYLEHKGNKMTANMLPFFRTMFKSIIVVIGILFIIVSLGFDIWPWMAGLSIGGLAIALAAQETIKNIFGSITILADRPFDVGDWIIYDKYEGTVEEIGIRSTTIRTFSDSVLTVPNGKLMDVTIDNMGLRTYRRFQTYLDIVYGTPVEMLETYVQGLEKLVQKHEFTRKDVHYIYISGLASSSIQIFIRIWLTSRTWKDELRDKHIFIKDMLELATTLGIEFAYPTQSLFIEHFPNTDSENKNRAYPTQEEITQKVNEFFNKKNVK